MSACGVAIRSGVDTRMEHRALLRTFREFGVVATDGELREDPDALLGAVAFLRHELLPFARREEEALEPGSIRREGVSFEHAFLAAEIDGFADAVAALLALPARPSREREEARYRVLRAAHRVETALELHVQKEEDEGVPAGPVEARRDTIPVASFRVTERARWSDVDAAGFVCYGAYLRFFELAETELFRAAGIPTPLLTDRHGLWLVRRRVECDFHQPVRLDEELEIHAFVPAIGRTSLEFGFVARRVADGDVAARSRYVLVAVDRERFRPVPIPDEVRAALSRFGAGAAS
jgi:YbgC/YbaW family acyl-CoA thioester hydrolase